QTHHYQHKRYRAPPVLPEGAEPMGALAPGPEDAEQQEDGAGDLANPPHGAKVPPCPPPPPGTPCRTRPPGARGRRDRPLGSPVSSRRRGLELRLPPAAL